MIVSSFQLLRFFFVAYLCYWAFLSRFISVALFCQGSCWVVFTNFLLSFSAASFFLSRLCQVLFVLYFKRTLLRRRFESLLHIYFNEGFGVR